MSNNIGNCLNLSRKWRSKQFDQLVGQSLVIKLVKNSLYKNLFFPVYLFSGPRGSGKTSTARIFASAINCDLLESFQKAPQKVALPCLLCKSCMVMKSQSHPDFIEIDAASNTGVDNIRVLIENSAFVPVLGKKKVYLIDEAHMLSKAAFNALLKIFEEPPSSVVFMLATTDPGKIIETVRSRCFQLFFKSIDPKDINDHLKFICKEENIIIDEEALGIISSQSQGSLRDALNLLEQAKLVGPQITKNLILDLLGHIDFSVIDLIIETIMKQDISELLNIFNSKNIGKYNSYEVFKKIKEALHVLLIKSYKESKSINKKYLLSSLEYCYIQEHLFTKTATPGILLQTILIRLCQLSDKVQKDMNYGVNSSLSKSNIEIETTTAVQPGNLAEPTVTPVLPALNDKMGKLLIKLEELKDPLLLSIFKQSHINVDTNIINIEFTEDSELFSDIIESKKKSWYMLIKDFYGELDIKYKFMKKSSNSIHNLNNNKIDNNKKLDPLIEEKPNLNQSFKQNFNDANKWPSANNLAKIFPGTIENN